MNAPNLRFGIAIPQRFPGEVDVSVLPPFFAAVEELGYDSCWVVEQAINAQNDLAPIPLLSYAAALTSLARLGSSVLISVLRNPINLAKSLATLDRLSNGRLIVGVGMGNATGAQFSDAFGVPASGKAARFEEGLLLMQRLWTGERVSFDGRFWQLDDMFISPTPVQRPIPLWFGGHAPAALNRAVRLGDGWMGAGASSTARVREELDELRRCLDQQRRDPATFETAKRVFVGVEDDRETALRRLQPWFEMHSGSGQRAERVGAVRRSSGGGSREVIDRAGLRRAGAAEALSFDGQLEFSEGSSMLAWIEPGETASPPFDVIGRMARKRCEKAGSSNDMFQPHGRGSSRLPIPLIGQYLKIDSATVNPVRKQPGAMRLPESSVAAWRLRRDGSWIGLWPSSCAP